MLSNQKSSSVWNQNMLLAGIRRFHFWNKKAALSGVERRLVLECEKRAVCSNFPPEAGSSGLIHYAKNDFNLEPLAPPRVPH